MLYGYITMHGQQNIRLVKVSLMFDTSQYAECNVIECQCLDSWSCLTLRIYYLLQWVFSAVIG